MPATRGEPTPATAARRAQIIAATIETIAEIGYGRTTFARITQRGGLSSTRLISYHFANKDELMKAVISDVYLSIDRFLVARRDEDPATRPIAEQVDASVPLPTAADELRAYLTAIVAFIDGHRAEMHALEAIFAALHETSDQEAYVLTTGTTALDHVAGILRRGQANGEFRAFDPVSVAAMIQRSLNGLPSLMRSKPDVDLRAYAAELVAVFDLATRSPNDARGGGSRPLPK